MPIENFRVLKGTASDLALDDDNSPHIEIRIEAGGDSHRIAVNVRSVQPPHDLLYAHVPLVHPITAQLVGLPFGVTDIKNDNPDFGIDYVRGGLIDREDMEIAPYQAPGAHNDLRDFIEPIVRQGMEDDTIHFYAFGSTWGPENDKKDAYFDFLPGRGIHNIHMNQGSKGRFKGDNGVNQDGCLLIHFSASDEWKAIFLSFQSQSWNTDPVTGHARDDTRPGGGDGDRRPGDPLSASVRIVGALINPFNPEEGAETVTLVNRADAAMSLDGWQLADRIDRRQTLSGELAAGEFRTIHIESDQGGPQLANKGGDIVLYDAHEVVADKVGYGKAETANEGWTTVF